MSPVTFLPVRASVDLCRHLNPESLPRLKVAEQIPLSVDHSLHLDLESLRSSTGCPPYF
jgi:hypothetical protein